VLQGPAVAEQHQRLAVVDPAAGGDGGQGGRVDARRGPKVEPLQALDPGEAGLVDAPLAAAGVAGVDLAGKQLGQEAAVVSRSRAAASAVGAASARTVGRCRVRQAAPMAASAASSVSGAVTGGPPGR
jgi:hypothetical protein